MGKVVKCSIIICDDFNAVLVVAKGKRKTEQTWSVFSRDIKGKESPERCASKAIDKDLNCIIFDMVPFKEYILDESSGDYVLVYTGKVKHYITPHKDISEIKWITERELNSYKFTIGEKNILLDFFEN